MHALIKLKVVSLAGKEANPREPLWAEVQTFTFTSSHRGLPSLAPLFLSGCFLGGLVGLVGLVTLMGLMVGLVGLVLLVWITQLPCPSTYLALHLPFDFS